MKKRSLKSLPVLMHHLISNDTTHISVRPAIFEEQCKTLAKKGWFGIGLEEAEEFLLNGTPLPEKSFLMTFDDGFLDNYVYAWPILRKYGHKGVIFVVTERIDRAQKDCAGQKTQSASLVRPTSEDIQNGSRAPEEMPPVDSLIHSTDLGFTVRRDLFMNWDEARLMEQSGVISIAGHSTRHGSVFAGPDYSGFTQPGNRMRTFTQTEPETVWGLPNFLRVPELANRAFLPAPELIEAITRLVPQEEKAALEFFRSPERTQELQTLMAAFKDKLGARESHEDMIQRMRKIMETTQETLRRELGHATRSFCWPWGNYCEEARQQGLAAGFSVFYTTRIGINPPASPLAVHRFKVKNRTDSWLLNRLRLYSRPFLGALYLKMRL